jgi:purine-binding chemotaxis protein CheW
MSTTATVSQARAQYLSFVLCGEEYAVNILRVKEIIEYDALTRVPSMPPAVRGVINLRGRVVPVVDLAARFGLAESGITNRSCIVMVELVDEGESMVVGIIADAVSQVLDLAPEDIEPPPAFGTRISARFIEGLTEAGRKFVILLDVDVALDAAAMAAGETPT